MPPIKVCVCTSYAAADEPRGPRHAVAIANLSREIEVVFIDCLRRGQPRMVPAMFAGVANLEYRSLDIPYRENGKSALLLNKLGYWSNRLLAKTFGTVRAGALSMRATKLEKVLRGMNADVYMGYNIDTLAPIINAAARNQAKTIFDCQEFYSDMGSWQTPFDKELVRNVERKLLPECSLVLAASAEIANELASVYGIRKPLAIYNVPPLEQQLPKEKAAGLALYWRNSTINLNQRGLGDGLRALSLLPADVTLHVQGRLPVAEKEQLDGLTGELGIADRVFVHPPYLPHEAVSVAARYSVGLCLEQSGCRNHDLTVSNKMFDYMMAGLAVLASDLPGLNDVIRRSQGGLLYQSGQSEDLAAKLMKLYQDRALLAELAANARSFALREGNLEFEAGKLQAAFSSMVDATHRIAAANFGSHHSKADAVQFGN